MRAEQLFDGSLSEVLRTLRTQPAVARHEIADSTGLTRTTVSKAVSELVSLGVVLEFDRGPASRRGGRRPILLMINNAALVTVGLELTDRHVRGCLIDTCGVLVASATHKLIGDRPELGIVATLVSELIGSAKGPAIGIGIARPDDGFAGLVQPAAVDSLDRSNLESDLEAQFEIPVVSSRSAVAGARGELQLALGEGVNLASSAFVALGDDSGIELGLIWHSATGSASTTGHGNLGHTTVDMNGPVCSCGRRGCLTLYASGRSLIERARQSGLDENPLTHAAGPIESGTREFVEQAGFHLGHAIVDVLTMFRPERLTIGGAHADQLPLYLAGVRRYLDEVHSSNPGPGLQERVGLARLGEYAASFGAAAEVLHDFVSSPSAVLSKLAPSPD